VSQIWVVRGGVGVYQSLEVGSIVSRDLFGADVPHLFIYSTHDDYVSTACWNGSCGDFVQTGNSVFPGQTLSPYSTPGTSNQWETPVRWMKDGNGGNWWLWVNGAYVGYYPRNLYSAAGVRDHADTTSFGGEITDHENLGLHTSTQMGSGYTPSSGFGFAAYQSSMRFGGHGYNRQNCQSSPIS